MANVSKVYFLPNFALPFISVWLVKSMIVICTLFFSVQPVPECYENNDCQRNEDICNLGSCINACRVADCGINARCVTGFHSHQCVCPDNYIGDPAIECYPCMCFDTYCRNLESSICFACLYYLY